MDYLNVVVRDKKTNKIIIEHPCPARRGKITLFANLPAAEQSVHPTAFGGFVAVAFLVGIIVGLLAARFGGG